MKFIPIRLKIIKPSKKREFDIYIMEKTKPVLLLDKNLPLDENSPILEYNSNFIAFIPETQLKEFKDFVSKNLDDILNDSSISKRNKMYAMYVSMINNMEALVNTRNLNLYSKVTKDVSKFIAQTINDSMTVSIMLSFIRNDSYNLAIHMFNVGVYASMLTKKLHPELSIKKMEEISKGYFLHDIGMLKIDKKIVAKRSKYTEEEYNEIKKHPEYGVKILRNELKIFSPIMEKIILEHHERKDGSGYPYGKTEINEFARICSMADIFDAITSQREYKENLPKTTFEALKEEKDFFIREFGKNRYETFIKCFYIPMK